MYVLQRAAHTLQKQFHEWHNETVLLVYGALESDQEPLHRERIEGIWGIASTSGLRGIIEDIIAWVTFLLNQAWECNPGNPNDDEASRIERTASEGRQCFKQVKVLARYVEELTNVPKAWQSVLTRFGVMEEAYYEQLRGILTTHIDEIGRVPFGVHDNPFGGGWERPQPLPRGNWLRRDNAPLASNTREPSPMDTSPGSLDRESVNTLVGEGPERIDVIPTPTTTPAVKTATRTRQNTEGMESTAPENNTVRRSPRTRREKASMLEM